MDMPVFLGDFSTASIYTQEILRATKETNRKWKKNAGGEGNDTSEAESRGGCEEL